MQAFHDRSNVCKHCVGQYINGVADTNRNYPAESTSDDAIKCQTITRAQQDVIAIPSYTRPRNSNSSVLKLSTLHDTQGASCVKEELPSIHNAVFVSTLPPSESQASASKRLAQLPPQVVHPSGDNHANHSHPSKHFNITEAIGRKYGYDGYVGSGSFGVVFKAHNLVTGERVAIKRVDQDPRYKNREIDIMKELNHPNIVQLKDYFYEEVRRENSTETNRYLFVVMDYIPDTIHRISKAFLRSNLLLPIPLVRLYTYQLCRSVGFLHSLKICHRDIKPHNLLVDSKTHALKLCDFGSAKHLAKSEQSIAYICSRFYRAPELMLGATEYTTTVDLWSIGCVLGELLLGRPLFSGETAVDQLVKIIRILGTPTKAQMQAMNPNYEQFRFPDVQPIPWRNVFRDTNGCLIDVPDDVISLLDGFLKYEPEKRIKAYQALLHPFFDALRHESYRLQDGTPLPNLFDFTPEERTFLTPEELSMLIPPWYTKSSTQSTSANSCYSTISGTTES